MRYDLAFFLCCCKSFLGSSSSTEEDYYELLGVDRDATADDIKRAYKRQSLQMHPDKLAQRGMKVTEAHQARFAKMKDAYEVLSDPHKRETYDAIGERGLKWLEEPFSMDPQEMAHNFAHSSALDRSKIFGIFVAIVIAIFLQPVLICLQVDGTLGNATWVGVFTPLWILNGLTLFYHSRVLSMGPIPKPEGVPDNEWIDPLPMHKRIFSLFRFALLILFEVFVALRLDRVINWHWAEVFSPIYIHELSTLYKKIPLVRMKIVTVEDLETALGKPFAEFTPAEKELISRRYSVVPSIESPEFETAHKVKGRAKQDIIKVAFRAVFIAFLVTQLQTRINWNWWLVFLPFWIMSFCVCCGSYQRFVEVQQAVYEKDPEMFTDMTEQMNGKKNDTSSGDAYGIIDDGNEDKKENLSEEEKDELKSQLMQAGYKMIGSFCSQCFFLIIVFLFVGKLQGAGYSCILIISPLLIVAGIILCCLGCTIFCITELDDDTEDLESSAMPGVATTYGSDNYMPPQVNIGNETPDTSSYKKVARATWDPEKGQVWVSPEKSPREDTVSVTSPASEFNVGNTAVDTSVAAPNRIDDQSLQTEDNANEIPSTAIDDLD